MNPVKPKWHFSFLGLPLVFVLIPPRLLDLLIWVQRFLFLTFVKFVHRATQEEYLVVLVSLKHGGDIRFLSGLSVCLLAAAQVVTKAAAL